MLWTKDLVKELKKKYDKAVLKGEESFEFHGNFFLVVYAKYLLEYLESKFKDVK